MTTSHIGFRERKLLKLSLSNFLSRLVKPYNCPFDRVQRREILLFTYLFTWNSKKECLIKRRI